MLELHVSSSEINSSTLAVSWCVGPETLELLSRLGIADPVIVLCTAPELPSEAPLYQSALPFESRTVVPLRDLMAYVELAKPGPNRIFGFIPLFSGYSQRQTKDFFMKKNRCPKYNFEVISSDGHDFLLDLAPLRPETPKDSIRVEVPAECFAPEPPSWEKAWVNHFFKFAPWDQCDFRRRRLFAYTLQPILMFFYLLPRLGILLFAILIGSRRLDLWKRTFQVLTYPTYRVLESNDVSSMVSGSWFIRDLKEDPPTTLRGSIWFLVRSYSGIIFMPLFAIPLVISMYFLGVAATLKGVGVILLSLFLLISLLFLVILGVGERQKILSWLDSLLSSDPLWYTQEEGQQHLVCNGQPRPTKVSELPPEHRTIRLRFKALKAKVCRPFAR